MTCIQKTTHALRVQLKECSQSEQMSVASAQMKKQNMGSIPEAPCVPLPVTPLPQE